MWVVSAGRHAQCRYRGLARFPAGARFQQVLHGHFDGMSSLLGPEKLVVLGVVAFGDGSGSWRGNPRSPRCNGSPRPRRSASGAMTQKGDVWVCLAGTRGGIRPEA